MVISGLDECGRGALAGPLVACAVSFLIPTEELIASLPTPLSDSKKLSAIQRQRIFDIRNDLPILYHIAEVTVEEINSIGIGQANIIIFERLAVDLPADKYLVDGNLRFGNPNLESIIRGDSLHPEIMLASILAKVHRDNLMHTLHKEFPHYGWITNVGYGSEKHISAIKAHGPCLHHRTQFITTALKNHNSRHIS